MSEIIRDPGVAELASGLPTADDQDGAASTLITDRFWLIVIDPGCVPERKGPWPVKETRRVLREFMRARPTSYVLNVREGFDGPWVNWGPEWLQMLDGRSMSVGRRHNAQVAVAHAPHHDLAQVPALRAALEEEREWHDLRWDLAMDAAREAAMTGEKADEMDAMRAAALHRKRMDAMEAVLRRTEPLADVAPSGAAAKERSRSSQDDPNPASTPEGGR